MIVAVGPDLHIRSQGPGGRLEEDFTAFQLGLLRAMCSMAQAKGAQALLLPGDVIDRYRLPADGQNEALTGLMDVIRSSGMAWFTTLGQHDVMGHSSGTYKTHSNLRLVEEGVNGQLTVVHSGQRVVFGDLDIYGFGYGDHALSLFMQGKVKPQNPDRINVALLHASVFEEPFMDFMTIDQVPANGFDLQVHGDIHPGFRPRILPPECLAVNMGVMTWQKRNETADCVPGCIGLVNLTADSTELLEVLQAPHPSAAECFSLSADEQVAASYDHIDDASIASAVQAMHQMRAQRGKIDEPELLKGLAEASGNQTAYTTAMRFYSAAQQAAEK